MKWILVGALLSLSGPAGALVASVTPSPSAGTQAAVVPASQTLVIKTSRDIAKGQLTIVAPGHSWGQLTLSAEPLKLGNYVATLRFPKLDGAVRGQLGDARLGCMADMPCAVEFEIGDAKSRGTYVGSVALDTGVEHLASATITLLLPDPGPAPTLASEFLKDDILAFDATRNDSFFLSVSNAAGSPSRALNFVALPGSGAVCTGTPGVAAQFYPSSVMLDGGATAAVRVQVPSCLGVGIYQSVLQITDADDGAVVASKEFKIIKAIPEASRRWTLLFWVVFGAALSVALNNAFPLRRARADRFDELSKVRAKLNACGSIGPALRGALRSEAQRLYLLIDSLTFVNTRKDAILAEAQQGVLALSQLGAVADCVNSLRAECNGAALPIRTLLVIAEFLRGAEEALMRSDVAGAQARVTAATQLARTDCDAKALGDDLTKDIAKLLAERPNNNDGIPATPRDLKISQTSREQAILGGRPRSIAQRVLLMERNQVNLNTQPLADLLILEREFYIADVWTNVVELTADNASGDAKKRLEDMLDPLLAQLEIAPSAAYTQLALSLVRSNLTFADLEAALDEGKAKIECNPYARFLDLENYQFQFASPLLSAVPATTQLLDYRWHFDDETTPPDDGDRCKHFFWAPSRWQRFWRWIGRRPIPSHQVTVTVTAPFTDARKPLVLTRSIAMQMQRDRASSLGAMQIITFLITTGMAVLASFGAQYGGVLPLTIDWGASVTALLFGFGIDQIRDRAASK